MFDKQINEQLSLLEKELSRLKKVTDYIDGAKKNSDSVIAKLEDVQRSYTVRMDEISSLYKQCVEDLSENTKKQIDDGVLKFETTGNKIDTTNKEKLVEIKHLLDQYKKTVEATDNLVKTLEAVDFPTILSTIDKNIQAVNSTLIKRFDKQDKEIKLLRTILFSICGLIVTGTVATILILK